LRPLQAGGHFYEKLAENYGGWDGGRGREKGEKWKEEKRARGAGFPRWREAALTKSILRNNS